MNVLLNKKNLITISLATLIFIATITYFLTRKDFSTDNRGQATTGTRYTQSLPTLADFWNKTAKFTNEEQITFPGTPYNSPLDFYYTTHDSGMAVIQDPANPSIIYYLADQWKGGSPYFLEPHLYKSIDGGKTFTHLTKLFDVLGSNETTCSQNSTYAYWNYNNQIYCHIQMREADIMYMNGAFYIIYESTAKRAGGTELLKGPTIVKLPTLNITSPVRVQHGVNFRQHPLLLPYDGDPNRSGIQETSISTPFWSRGASSISVFWAGISPSNVTSSSLWERVDTYRGTFITANQANCMDPIFCLFKPNEYLTTSPNFRINPAIAWEYKVANGLNIVNEGAYNYMLYIGSSYPDFTNTRVRSQGGISIVRSSGLSNWERKFTNPSDLILYANENTSTSISDGMIGKLVKLNGKYYVYYLKSGPPLNNGQPVARNYRMQLNWINPILPTSTPTPPPPSPTVIITSTSTPQPISTTRPITPTPTASRPPISSATASPTPMISKSPTPTATRLTPTPTITPTPSSLSPTATIFPEVTETIIPSSSTPTLTLTSTPAIFETPTVTPIYETSEENLPNQEISDNKVLISILLVSLAGIAIGVGSWGYRRWRKR